MIVSVDTGNKQIKTKHFTFVSGLLESDTVPDMVSITDYIKYEGKYYTLTNKRGMYQRDKSETELYFRLVLMGICKELDLSMKYEKDKIYPITLLCGLPPAHMKDRELVKNMKAYLRTPEPVKVQFKGKMWTVKVNKVHVYPQCFAAIVTHYQDVKGYPRVVGIDIGGFTTDYLMMMKGNVNIEYTDSMEYGVIRFYREVDKECKAKFNAIIDETDVDEILAGRTEFYEAEIVDKVNELAKTYVEKILSSFREFDIDLKHSFVVFVGGGSILLKKFIRESLYINKYMFIDEVNANVLGYEMLYQMSKRKNSGG